MFLLWFLTVFNLCQVFKAAWVINQIEYTSSSKFLVLVIILSIKCLQLTKFKSRCYKYFINLDFCELIKEKCEEVVSLILNTLFSTAIPIYSSVHVLFFLNSKVFSYSFSYIVPFVRIKYLLFHCLKF